MSSRRVRLAQVSLSVLAFSALVGCASSTTASSSSSEPPASSAATSAPVSSQAPASAVPSQPAASELPSEEPAQESSPEPSQEPSSEPSPTGPQIEDGVWIVGEDVPAGVYTTVSQPEACYWAIYKANTNQDNIINNANVAGGFPTVVLRKGMEFESSDCGVWTTQPTAALLAEFGDGVWTVGRDIKPGTYRVSEEIMSDCYWATVKSKSNGDNILNNANVPGGFPTVTLRKGMDFESGDCGTWGTDMSGANLSEFGDGIWTVGRDIKPGRYRLAESVLGSCYWATLKSGTNADNILNNANVEGGRPSVTLRKGMDFESSDCGIWAPA